MRTLKSAKLLALLGVILINNTALGGQLTLCDSFLANLSQDPHANIAYTIDGMAFKLVNELTGPGRNKNHSPLAIFGPHQMDWLESSRKRAVLPHTNGMLPSTRLVVDRMQVWQPEAQPSKLFLRIEYRLENLDPRVAGYSEKAKNLPDSFGIEDMDLRRQILRPRQLMVELPVKSGADYTLLKTGQMLVIDNGRLVLTGDLTTLATKDVLNTIEDVTGLQATNTPISDPFEKHVLLENAEGFTLLEDSSETTGRVHVKVQRRYLSGHPNDWPAIVRFTTSRSANIDGQLSRRTGQAIPITIAGAVINPTLELIEPRRRGDFITTNNELGKLDLALDIYKPANSKPLNLPSLATPSKSWIDRIKQLNPFSKPEEMPTEFTKVHILSSDNPWSFSFESPILVKNLDSIRSMVKTYTQTDGSTHSVSVRGEESIEFATLLPYKFNENSENQTSENQVAATQIPLSITETLTNGRSIELPLAQASVILQRLIVAAYSQEGQRSHVMAIHDLMTGLSHKFLISNRAESDGRVMDFDRFNLVMDDHREVIRIHYRMSQKTSLFRERDLKRSENEYLPFEQRVSALLRAMLTDKRSNLTVREFEIQLTEKSK